MAAVLTIFLISGGCDFKPIGPDTGDTSDGGATQKSECTNRLSSCRNNCYKADLGALCRRCCADNAAACDRGDDYSFNACLDL